MSAQTSFKTQVGTTSATLSDLGKDLTTSMVRVEPDGKRYRLFKNGTTVTTGENSDGKIYPCRTLELLALGTDNVATVIVFTTGPTTNDCIGCTITYNGGDEATATPPLGSVPFGHYFWAQISGICRIKGTTTVKLPVTGSTTDGLVANAAASDTINAIGTSLATTSSAIGAVLLYIG